MDLLQEGQEGISGLLEAEQVVVATSFDRLKEGERRRGRSVLKTTLDSSLV